VRVLPSAPVFKSNPSSDALNARLRLCTVTVSLPFVVKMISQYKDQNEIDSYNTIIKSFGEFINSNVDCDADEIKNSLMSLLRQISEADGQLSEKEEIEIDYIGNLLKV